MVHMTIDAAKTAKTHGDPGEETAGRQLGRWRKYARSCTKNRSRGAGRGRFHSATARFEYWWVTATYGLFSQSWHRTQAVGRQTEHLELGQPGALAIDHVHAPEEQCAVR